MWQVKNDENSCNTVMQNNGFKLNILFLILLYHVGTHMIYSNAVQKSIDWGSNMIISRGTGKIVRFTCAYAMSQHVSLR